MLLMQYLGQLWQFTQPSREKVQSKRRNTQWQRRRKPQRRQPRRKRSKYCREAWASLIFVRKLASAIAVRGGFFASAGSTRGLAPPPGRGHSSGAGATVVRRCGSCYKYPSGSLRVSVMTVEKKKHRKSSSASDPVIPDKLY